MSIVKSFDGNMVDFGECMGCTIANSFGKETDVLGQVIKTKYFNIAQDSELPIDGFMVIGSIRHIGSINEMTLEEQQELIVLINQTILSLKKIGVCKEYDVVWEEKANNHFHVWLMPRHKYLLDAMGTNIIRKVGELFDYAKTNLRTEENLNKVFDTVEKLKEELHKNETIKRL